MSTVEQFEIEAEELVAGSAANVQRKKLRANRYTFALTCITFFCCAVFGALSFYWKGGQDDLSLRFQKTGGPTSSTHEDIAARQIESFRRGDGILVNFHITHQGGTTVCREMSQNLPHPSFACMGVKPEDNVTDNDYPKSPPWTYNDTEKDIEIVRKYFRFISWEFRGPPGPNKPQIPDTDWENPNLVTMFVARDPLSRALAGDGINLKKYASIFKYNNATEADWWQFAKDKKNYNYALRILSDHTCCDGNNTSLKHLEKAKKLIQRFTFVLDIACLEQGLEKIAETLGFSLRHHPSSNDKGHHHATVQERIPYPAVYEFLKENNKVDIELYEWTKSVALVDCEAVLKEEENGSKL